MQQNQEFSNEKRKIFRPHWTDIEIETLEAAYEKYGPNWKLIQQELPGRSIQQCVQKWKRIKPAELMKQCRWSEAEDSKLKDLYLKHGPCWKQIALEMGNRNSIQVRQRYANKLNPNRKNGKWSEQEDEKLFYFYSKVGSKWTYIGQQLGGRADNDVKNRFYSKRNSRSFNENQIQKMNKISKKQKLNESNYSKVQENNQYQKVEDVEKAIFSLKEFQQSMTTERQLISTQNQTQGEDEYDPYESLQMSVQLNENELIFYQTISEQYDEEYIHQSNNAQFNFAQQQQNIIPFQSLFNQPLESDSIFQQNSQAISSVNATQYNSCQGEQYQMYFS